MTIDEYIAQLGRQIEEVVVNRPLERASLTAHQQASERIFTKSLDANESTITYSQPTKKARKGAYSRRYALFRERSGRTETSRVDFRLSGEFSSDYMNSPVSPIKINNDEYIVEFKRENHPLLRRVFEDIYYKSKIFSLSKREKRIFHSTAREYLMKILK